jgi:hypothetical protein
MEARPMAPHYSDGFMEAALKLTLMVRMSFSG